MDLVHLPALHQWLVDVLGVRATPFEPGPDGVLMQAKGEHDGLDRAAVGEQGQHHRHQHHVVVQTIERRAGRGGETMAAAAALEPPLLAALDRDVACGPVARTGGGGAQYPLRVEWVCHHSNSARHPPLGTTSAAVHRPARPDSTVPSGFTYHHERR